jgi:hypothetical protein
MGLPLTSDEWMRDSATWHEENEEKRIIDVVSDDNKMESYYFEGKKLYTFQRFIVPITCTQRISSAGLELANICEYI